MTLVEHLEELRDRIIRVLGVFSVGSVVGWFVQPLLFKSLNEWIDRAVRAGLPPGAKYIEAYTKGITEPFMLQLQFAMLIGLILTIPVIVLQVWGFLAPALRESEQRPFKRLAPISVGLFILGAV
ncbi:MAG: preprotein translocase subunit TatC, partial [Verrucomicrobiaceae bacterium]